MIYKSRKPFAVMTSVALGLSLLSSPTAGTVFAEEMTAPAATTTDVKITFPDIASTHWARSHVAKLAAAGIVKGYTTGNYSPNNNVTQQEAIVMVIRMMGLEEEALAGSNNIVTGFREDKFFTKYVVKALEKRIINLGEETVAAAADETPWGSRPASREWVAKLVVRAIGEEPATGALTFADASHISADTAGFVAKSQSLELVTGFTDNTFKPKDAVTRAQIATILSRADKYIQDDPERSVSGFVTSRSGATLQLQTTGGTVRTFTINTETLVFDEAGSPLDLSAVTDMKSIRIIQQNNQAYYIEVTGETVQMETIEGELMALDISNMTLVLERSNGNMEAYTLVPTVMVTTAQGSGMSLSQLTEGSSIRLQRMQGTTDISSVVLIEAAYNADGTSIVQAVDAEERTVTFTDAQGDMVTFPVDMNAALTVKGEALSALNGLQVGDTFTYQIKDSIIVAIDITVQKHIETAGQFQGYAGNTITILENSTTPKAYLLKNNVKVVIEGLSDTGMDDLQVGDIVHLRIAGESNEVELITVTNRNVTLLRSAAILNLEDDYLTVRDEKGKPRLLYITDRSRFMLDGEPMSEQLFAMYLSAGRKVNLNVTADQLVRLDIVTKVSGIITAINTTSRTMTVMTEENTTVTVPYSLSALVEVPLESNASLTDVKVGARVHLNMGMNSDAASSIQLEKSFVYTLNSIVAGTRMIYLKDGKGQTSSMSLNTSVKVLNKSGQGIAITELGIGNPILVNYVGRSAVSVQQTATVFGKISTLDVTGGKLAITDFNNNVRNYDLAKGITVQEGTVVTSTASSLQLNDRVMLIVDAQGKPYVQVANAEVRKFSAYDAAKNEISLKIVKLGDQNKYLLDSNTYLHTAAGGLLALNRLKENDQLTVYLLNGKIIEIIQ